VYSSLQTDPAPTNSRSTGFVAVDDGKGPAVELQVFGTLFVVVWTGLLAFVFLTRRRQRALRADIERLSEAFEPEYEDE
jgi:hypothetical protein